MMFEQRKAQRGASSHDTTAGISTRRLWRRFLVLIPLALVLALVSWVCVRSTASTYTAEGYVTYADEVFSTQTVSLEPQGIVDVVSANPTDRGTVRVTFRAIADGHTKASFGSSQAQDVWDLSVVDGLVFEGANFAGWEVIHVCLCVFFAATTALFALMLATLLRRAWYDYEMVACGGGLLFFLFQCVAFTHLLVSGSLHSFSAFAFQITNMADWFVTATLIPMAMLALLVSVSNISLIRHEGRRPVNLLGIAVSIVWGAACLLWYGLGDFLYTQIYSFAAVRFVDSLVASGITFGECLLLSTMFCAWHASRHVPAYGVDYLVVLGCGIRPDGTPSPLLAGRVDRAFDFDQARTAAGDAPATFVPSGGKGADEPMSEAQSMCDYLLGKGINRQRIVLEDRSTTTRENMAYSRTAIESNAGCDVRNVRVAFSTTNYHVFRGYVCAHQAGIAIEGMGSKTKAYFWPNAFLREFAGLLATQWKAILQTFLIVSLIYGIAEYALLLA